MTKETRQRIIALQKVAREARYNHNLALKRLETAQRRKDADKTEYENLLVDVWQDTYVCAKEDLLDLQGV